MTGRLLDEQISTGNQPHASADSRYPRHNRSDHFAHNMRQVVRRGCPMRPAPDDTLDTKGRQ